MLTSRRQPWACEPISPPPRPFEQARCTRRSAQLLVPLRSVLLDFAVMFFPDSSRVNKPMTRQSASSHCALILRSGQRGKETGAKVS
ncbi:uncharacterized [Tachysurus ichikawai]